MTAEKSTRRKRVKLTEGDVFEFAVPDGRLGYGIMVKRGSLPNGGTPNIAIFRSLFDARPDIDQLVRDEVALAGWTMDGLVYHGRWNVIAHGVPLPPSGRNGWIADTGSPMHRPCRSARS